MERYIVHHRLKRGDPLPTETEFAKQLKVNRSTVRVAIKGLEMLGMLTFTEGSGYTVGSPGLIDLAREFSSYLHEDEADFKELVETRLFFEINILPLVSERATEEDFKRLQRNIDDHRQAGEQKDLGTLSINDIAFHQGLFEASRNQMLKSFAHLVKGFFVDIRRAPFARVKPPGVERTLREHQAICDALRRRDARQAQEVMYAHLSVYLPDPADGIDTFVNLSGNVVQIAKLRVLEPR